LVRSPVRRGFFPLLVLAAGFACGQDGDAPDDGALEHPVPGSRPSPGIDDRGGSAATATVRVANLAPHLGPIDLCYRTAGTGTFEGPVFGGTSRVPEAPPDEDAEASAPTDAGGDGGAPTPLGYRSVSKYVSLTSAGPLAVAIVRAGSGSCANALVTGAVTLDPGKLSTLVLFARAAADGDAGSDADGSDADANGGSRTDVVVVAFTDDRTTAAEKARVRLIHAASAEAALAVRAVAGQTSILAERVERRRASTPSETVDALGYAEIAPLPPPTSLTIGPAAGTTAEAAPERWQSDPHELELRGGSLHTGFVLTGESAPFEVLWCADTSTVGDRTACLLVR
jgi:hypothetical protein